MASPIKEAKLKHEADGFTEVSERGKGWLKSHKPDTNQYALTTQIGNVGWHRGNSPFTEDDEIDTNWQVSAGTWDYEMTQADYQAYIDTSGNYRYEDYLTGEYVDLNITFFGWTNDEGQSQQIPFNQVTPSVDGDILTWDELFGTGTAVQIQNQTSRFAKFINVSNLIDLPSPTIGGTNIQLTLSYQMIRSNDLDIYADSQIWDDNSTITTVQHIEFRQSSTGVPVWWFIVPTAWDVDDDKVSGSQTLKQAGANLFVDEHIPYSWISSASFPIIIDPTINPQVGASGDDGDWFEGNSTIVTGDANIGVGDISNPPRNLFALFVVTGPESEDVIDVAYIELLAASANSTTCDFTICCVDEDDPSAPTTYSDAETANRTSTVSWIPGSWSYGVWNGSSVSIVTPIQEVIDRAGWSSGNNLIVYVEEYNSDTGAGRVARSYDQVTTNAPKLHIEYTSVIAGDTTWGHDTDVTETNVRDFTGNWTGTGAIAGSGDTERLELESGESMESEIVETGAYTVTLIQNKYGSGDSVTMEYRHAATAGDVSGASYNTYSTPFTSLGYVQIRLTSTL